MAMIESKVLPFVVLWYSAAVLARKDIKVKYAVKALTDAEGKGAAGIAHRGLYVGRGRARDRSVVWTAGGLQDEESAGKSAEAGEAKEAEAEGYV